MTTHIVFHRADLDGIGSCMVVLRHILPLGVENIRLHAWNYGEPMPKDFNEGDNIYIVDCSFKPQEMKDLYHASLEGMLNVTWIDHHKTSDDESVVFGYDKMGGVRSQNRPAAIELCWYFFQNARVPEGIRLLSRYDTWCNEDKEEWNNVILPYQFGMRNIPWLKKLIDAREDTERLQNIVNHFFVRCEDIDFMLTTGETILTYQRGLNEAAARTAFPYSWKGIKFAVINGTGNSQLFDTVDFDCEAYMLFRFDGTSMKWRFSLYGKEGNTIDLSEIAKSMGGGGHKSACGFEVSELRWVFNNFVS